MKILIFAVVFIIALIFPENVSAQSYNYDIWGDAVPSQAGYVPLKSVSGKSLNIGDFSSPSDLFRNDDGTFFIADSGNNRIIKVNPDFSQVLNIIENISFNNIVSHLKNPEGIYFLPYNNLLYIADTDNSRIIRCDENGIADMIIQNEGFFPHKVISDKAGFIYAVSDNSSNGAEIFDSEGNFMGYYNVDRVKPASEVVYSYIMKSFGTYLINSKNIRNIPSEFTNFDIDKAGFIFTCTETSSDADAVKKINFSANNLFEYNTRIFGDYTEYYDTVSSAISDIDISESGYINCLDHTSGRIFQYDEDLRLIFITGGKSDSLGGFRNVSAIESSDDFIYVSDSEKNTVTIFQITEFGSNVHNALSLSRTGEYEKAFPLWINALEYDGNYFIACEEISNAFFYMGDYKSAMDYAERCFSSELYNRAFEEYRMEFLSSHSFVSVFLLILSVTAVLCPIKKSEKFSYSMNDVSYFQWCIYAMRCPFESFSDIIWKKKCSFIFTGVILLLFFISEIFNECFYGLQFHAQYSKTFSIFPYLFKTVVFFLIWSAGNWSVCCLLDGKGTFKNICAVSAYSIVPYIIQNFLTAILSRFLVYDEKIFLISITAVSAVWSAIMMFSAVKTVHQYSVGKTVKAIILTFFAMAVIFFLMVLVLMLSYRIYIFIYSLYTELVYRLL